MTTPPVDSEETLPPAEEPQPAAEAPEAAQQGAETIAPAAPVAEVALPPIPPERQELRDFFASVSGLGANVRKRYHQVVPEQVRSRRGVLVMSGMLAAIMLVRQALANRPPDEMPVELRGAWATESPSYADRPFWIGTHQLAFKTGPEPDDVVKYTVTHLELTSTRGDTTTYDIDYAVEGGVNRWSVRHVWLPKPAIMLVHQPQMTWLKRADREPPVPLK